MIGSLARYPGEGQGLILATQVSNITDGAYLGVHRTIFLMIPLLQAPPTNPHATLVTLFMNVVDEYGTSPREQAANVARAKGAMPRLLKHLSIKGMPAPFSPDMSKFMYAMGYVLTYDHILDR